jgi:hypothetical protein
MAVTDNDRKNIDAFFAAISSRMSGYRGAFHYVAVRDGDRFVILQARLYLNTGAVPPERRHIETANVRAGILPLAELGDSPQQIVDRLIGGPLRTPDGELYFLPRNDSHHGAAFMPYNPQDVQARERLHLLSLVGSDQNRLLTHDIDWELRAAATPYDGLQELLIDHQLGTLRTDAAAVEVVAFNVAAVDFSSKVAGTKASPGVLLAHGLDRLKAALSYRVILRQRVMSRGLVRGGDMAWADGPISQRGSAELQIPDGAVVHCAAVYDGHAQHHGWIADPSTSQNPRRAVYEANDAGMNQLRDMLSRTGRGRDARELETGVAWLLWMLGFNTLHLGGSPRMQDAADLIAVAPAGHFAVVECTTGTLKSDSKMTLVIARAAAVKQRLAASGNSHVRVLPVMVTSLTRDEVLADLEQAEKLGIAVVTKEDLDTAIERTLVFPEADRFFVEAEESVKRGTGALDPQGTLGLTRPTGSDRAF